MADELQAPILIKILDAFTGPLRNLKGELVDVEKAATNIEKKFKLAADLNQAAESAGRFSSALLGPIKASVEEFASFEAAMSRVQALTGTDKGSAALESLKKQAMELGAATSYSSEEAAEAMQEYASAGFKVNEILSVVPQTMSAAKANATSLADTAGIVGGTMKAMGIEIGEASRVVDVLTKAGADSKANLQDLGHAMSIVGPVARTYGMSLEMTAAMIGKLRDAEIDASSGATGMRATMQKLIDPSREARAAFKALGYTAQTFADMQKQVATGKLDEALRGIGEASEKLPDEKRLKAIAQIFGLDAAASANVLISASMDTSSSGLGALNKSLHTLNDDTNKMAAVMDDNLQGAFERAGGAISGLKTQLGAALEPTAKGAASTVESLAGSLTKFASANPKATKATLELVATMGLAAGGLKGVLITMSTLTSASAMLEKSFTTLQGSMAGRFGLVAAAAAAGYAIGTWLNETFELSERINEMLGRGKPTTAQAGDRSVTGAGGWSYDPDTGVVTAMGRGAGPKQVQEARAAGAITQEQINDYIRTRRAARTSLADIAQGINPNAPLMVRTAQSSALAGSPLVTPTTAAMGMPQATMPSYLPELAQLAARQNDEAAKQTAVMSEVLAEMRRLNLKFSTPGSMPALVPYR